MEGSDFGDIASKLKEFAEASGVDQQRTLAEMMQSARAAGVALGIPGMGDSGEGEDGETPPWMGGRAGGPLGKKRLEAVLESLQAEGDDARQLSALMELCETLSVATEEHLSSFSIGTFVPVLVQLLQVEYSPDIPLLACRALTHLMEANPGCCGAVVGAGAVPVLCAKLLSIEYIDVAEQSLSALDRLSQQNAPAVLKEGGLVASLAFMDFFNVGVQRTAARTASALCRQVPRDGFTFIENGLDNLTSLLQRTDRALVESGVLAFSRLVETIGSHSEANLVMLGSKGAFSHLIRLVSVTDAPVQLSSPSYIRAIRTLASICRFSPQSTLDLLNCGLAQILQDVLTTLSHSPPAPASTPLRSPAAPSPAGRASTELAHEVLSLVVELTPCVPDGVFDSPGVRVGGGRVKAVKQTPPTRGVGKRAAHLEAIASAAESAGIVLPERWQKVYLTTGSLVDGAEPLDDQEDEEEEEEEEDINALLQSVKDVKIDTMDPRITLYKDHPELLTLLSDALISPLLSAYSEAVAPTVKKRCVDAITRLVYASHTYIPLGTFLASLLSDPSVHAVVHAMFLAEVLINKSPDAFSHFAREGVIHEATILAETVIPPFEKKKVLKGEEEDHALRVWVKERAAKFIASCSLQSASSDNLSGEMLSDLTTTNPQAVEIIRAAVQSVVSDQVSTFQVEKSRVIPALLMWLTGESAVARSKLFVQAVMPDGLFAGLVNRLHLLVNRSERLPVPLSDWGTGPSALRALTNPFKLRFTKMKKECVLGEHPPETVGIDPLASVSAISDYLWHRFQQREKKKLAALKGEEEVTVEDDDDSPQKIVLCLGEDEEPLPFELPFIQVVLSLMRRQRETDEEANDGAALLGRKAWSQPYTLFYRMATSNELDAQHVEINPKFKIQPQPPTLDRKMMMLRTDELRMQRRNLARANKAQETVASVANTAVHGHSLSSYLSTPQLPGSGRLTETTHDALALLRVLDAINRLFDGHTPLLDSSLFNNPRLSTKLTRLLQDGLVITAGCLPSWATRLIHAAPFLFPWDVRQLWLAGTSFGTARALERLQGSTPDAPDRHEDDPRSPLDFRVGRVMRHKVRVERDRLLESAVRVMDIYGTGHSILEVEYFNEVGTGLGPTHEFYSIVSREISSVKGMWMESNAGLWPSPFSATTDLKLWKFLGCFVGRALMDDRLMDLPLAPPLWKLVGGRGGELGWNDAAMLMPQVTKAARDAEEGHPESLLASECDFRLPGWPLYEFLDNGAEVEVTKENAVEWAGLFRHHLLIGSVWRQVDAMRQGLASAGVNPDALGLFSPDELDAMVCGSRALFTLGDLEEHAKCDHGYTANSQTVKWLFEIMVEMPSDVQKKFLAFATGAPGLPVGGLAAIKPQFTVVRKGGGDLVLPTVSTCAHYLKLPEYSSKEVMRERLMLALVEGQESFHMS